MPRWLLVVLIVLGVGVVVSVVVSKVWKRESGPWTSSRTSSVRLGSFDIAVPDGWRAWDDQRTPPSALPANTVGMVTEAPADGVLAGTITLTLDAPVANACDPTEDVRDYKKLDGGGCSGVRAANAVDVELFIRNADGKQLMVQCFHEPKDADGAKACATVRSAVGFK